MIPGPSRAFYGPASAAALLAALPHATARAQPPAPHAPHALPARTTDKSAYHLFNPVPRALMRDMSTDRPDTTESPYTLDAGHVQLELSFVDYTYDRQNNERVTSHALAVAPLLLKVGLLNNVDLQLGIDPYTRTEQTARATDAESTSHGFGDTVVRLKVNLWGNDAGETALALMPFIKLPTAPDELGNANLEGGMIIPFAMSLPAEFSLGLMAEFDFIRNGADDRYVVDFVHTATLSRALVADLGGYIEYAGFASFSHDEEYRAYFDAGLTYGLSPDTQLDAGVRVGLTEAAEDLGIFAGLSLRF